MFQDLLGLAEEGNPAAEKALGKQALYIGQGLRVMMTGLSPERIFIAVDITLS